MRHVLAILVFVLLAATASAAPKRYLLEADKSQVAFAWDFGKDEINGQMPVVRADLTIDFAKVSNSSVDVAVNVVKARAGFPFATQAMKGPKILNAAQFPEIKFISTRVRANGAGALIDGNITVRGVTHPMTFAAEIFRQRGSELNDLTHLAILLTGALSRSSFGATGWSNLAGDEVRLQILANIKQVE